MAPQEERNGTYQEIETTDKEKEANASFFVGKRVVKNRDNPIYNSR